MTRTPYKRRPRLLVDVTRHELGDVVTVGNTRWKIQELNGDRAVLEAMNIPGGIIWRTTLDRLPEPKKDRR
ncbi:hypothetical protein [Microbacterium maritypicum]